MEISFGKNSTSASISHFQDGVVISASTLEKQVSSQLYRLLNILFYMN